jgi:hypothetical protein
MKNPQFMPFLAAIIGGLFVCSPAAADHPDTKPTAQGISSGVTSGRIEVDGDVDWFKFRSMQGGAASLNILPGATGSILGDFLVVVQNDQGGNVYTRRGEAQFRFIAQPAKWYFVSVVRWNRPVNEARNYRLKLLLPEGATPWPAASKLVGGRFETENDANLFSFNLPEPGLVNLNFRPDSVSAAPINIVGELLNSAGSRVSTFTSGDCQVRIQQPGRYFVRAIPHTVPNVGAYALQLCTKQLATVFTQTYWGNLDVPSDRDFVAFDARSNQTVRIAVSGTPRVFGELFNAAGDRLGYVDSGSTGFIDRVMATGRYYLLLEPSNLAAVKTGNYRVTVSQ